MYGAAVDLVASGKIPDMTTAVQDVTQSLPGAWVEDLQQVIPDMQRWRIGHDGCQRNYHCARGLAASRHATIQYPNGGTGPTRERTRRCDGERFASGAHPICGDAQQYRGEKLTAWADAHPELAEAILVFLGIIGAALIVLGAILVPLGLLIIAAEALTTGLALLGIAATVTLGSLMLYIGIFVAIAAIVALVIVYHKQIEDAIKAAWDAIVGFVQDPGKPS